MAASAAPACSSGMVFVTSLAGSMRPLEIISDAWHELCAATEAGTAA